MFFKTFVYGLNSTQIEDYQNMCYNLKTLYGWKNLKQVQILLKLKPVYKKRNNTFQMNKLENEEEILLITKHTAQKFIIAIPQKGLKGKS